MEDKEREEALRLHELILQGIQNMKDSAVKLFPYFEAFTEKVLSETVTDLKVIERELENMMDLDFDDDILLLYKKILKKIYPRAPEIVEFFVEQYYEMNRTEDDVDFELEGSTVNFIHKSIQEKIDEFFADVDID